MSEYIIEWFGIGSRIVELMGSETPCLAVKHLRKERLREPIVRCRDCKHHEYWEFRDGRTAHNCARDGDYLFDTEPNGFCAWGERQEKGKGNDGE